MGRIGNALKRGLPGGGGGKKKDPVTGRLAGGCLGAFVMLVLLIVCIVLIFPTIISKWVKEGADAIGSAVEGAVNAPGGTSGSGGQQAPGVMTIEQKVVSGTELPPMSDEMRKDALLQVATVEELVNGTLKPFGEAGDGDERFDSITIRTEIVQKVRIHPSDEETERYRNEEYGRMYEAKRQAAREAAEAAEAAEALKEAMNAQKEAAGKKKGKDKKPAPTPTRKPTPTPIPEPAWDSSDQAELDRRVAEYVRLNTKEEERSSFVGRTIDGEKLRAYLNSFHTPWQSNYSEAAFIAMFDYGYAEGTETAIQPEVVSRVFEYGNMLSYKLYLDYWGGREYWEEEEFLYEDRENVFGGEKKAYDEYEDDYSADPVYIDEHTDLIGEKGFIPVPLFDHISDWAIDTTYGSRTGGYNSYGIPVQAEKKHEASVAFSAFSEGLELTDLDLELFVESYRLMPECEEQYRRLSMMADLYSPDYYRSGVVISDFAHLSGGDEGARAAYAAMEVVQRAPVYSQSSRESATAYDCSSLVSRVYDSIGIHDFHPGYSFDTEALLGFFESHGIGVVTGGWPEDESVLMPGDVIMWARPSSTKYKHVYHTGLWIGDGYIADASSSLGHVVYREMWGKNEVIMIARPSLMNIR